LALKNGYSPLAIFKRGIIRFGNISHRKPKAHFHIAYGKQIQFFHKALEKSWRKKADAFSFRAVLRIFQAIVPAPNDLMYKCRWIHIARMALGKVKFPKAVRDRMPVRIAKRQLVVVILPPKPGTIAGRFPFIHPDIEYAFSNTLPK